MRITLLMLGSLVAVAAGCSAGQSQARARASSPPEPPKPVAKASAATQAKLAGEGENAAGDTSADQARGQDTTPEQAQAAEGGKPSGAAQTSEERRSGLDEKLDESLREFDGLLLRERETLEERHEATAAAASRGGGAGGGGGMGALDEADSADAEASRGGSGTGGSPDAPDAYEPAAPGEPTEDGERTEDVANGRVPEDVGDGADDDIVARQLREAAMNEEDPALRERLWEEYRTYKAGLRK